MSFVISDGYQVKRPGVYEQDGYQVKRPGVYEQDGYQVKRAKIEHKHRYQVKRPEVYERDAYYVKRVTTIRMFNVSWSNFGLAFKRASIIPSFAFVTIRFKVENAIVCKSYYFHDKYNLDDYSMIHEGSKVKSIASNQEGVVTKKKVIEVDEIPVTTIITVKWNNGDISHPYPHQIAIKWTGNLDNKQLTSQKIPGI